MPRFRLHPGLSIFTPAGLRMAYAPRRFAKSALFRLTPTSIPTTPGLIHLKERNSRLLFHASKKGCTTMYSKYPNRYDAIAMGLHWTIAILILVAFGLGLTVDDFPKSWEDAVVNSHALIGLAVLLLSLVRLGWRFSHRPPDLPRDMAPLIRAGSKTIHILLYVLMIAVPVIGIPTLLYRGRGLNLGLFEVASPFSRTPDIYRPLTETHELAAYTLIGLAAAHIIAALYHQFIRKDEILLRMLPGSLTGR